MKPFLPIAIALLAILISFPLVAQAALREVIVSHTDEKGVLQLYRMKEDGAGSRQLTYSKRGCRQPSCSPDGFVTRAFPDPKRGGPIVMVESASGDKALPIVPPRRNWGRFTWVPQQVEKKAESGILVVATYNGRIRAPGFDRNFRKVTGPIEMTIKTPADYEAFVAKIPKRQITKTNPAPPSKDPLLKKPPIDFTKHMMLVAIRPDSMYVSSQFQSIVADKDTLRVHILDPDLGETRLLNQMQGIGTYLAVVVPKRKGPIQFIRKKGKGAPR